VVSLRVIAALLLFLTINVSASERWWPTQKIPKALLRTSPSGAAQDMMVQSIAGLAAKAVNEGQGDELVWVETGNPSLKEWLARWQAAHPTIITTNATPWELVDHFAQRGVVKGYILYSHDKSRRELNAYSADMDCSVNVATSLASVLDAIIIDESIEQEAAAHGLKRLADARGKTQAWCFETYRDQFNRSMVCTQDPKKPHTRDFAIAQKAFVVYGAAEPTPALMKWLQPLSPILGWNGGDEFETTDLSSKYAHIQTATDWCMNLPVLMAGSEETTPANVKSISPKAIDFADQRSAVSFIQTDGDNVQWLEGNFFHHPSYWANPDRGRIPFGWSTCFAQLAQLAPQAIEFAIATASTNDSLIEWGGGYYYPDHFAAGRSNRWELLAQHARRTAALMKKTNSRIIAFNVTQHDSPDARKSYEVFARETEGLLGILIFQYSPYEAGAGKTFWVKDRNNLDLPVITARYAIWENSNQRLRSGTPAKVARELRDIIQKSSAPRYDWVITHAWSYFKKAPGSDENAENIPQDKAHLPNVQRGYTPVAWCAERLPQNICVVTAEELLWRIRMQHDPAKTKKLIEQFDSGR
jgi:hypothetical protein